MAGHDHARHGRDEPTVFLIPTVKRAHRPGRRSDRRSWLSFLGPYQTLCANPPLRLRQVFKDARSLDVVV